MIIETTKELTTAQRTARVVILSEIGTDYRIYYTRERVSTTEAGDLLARENLPEVIRYFSKASGDAITLADGTQLTGAQLAEAVAAFGDKWAKEDAVIRAKQEAEAVPRPL